MDLDDVGLVDCSQCGCQMVGERTAAYLERHPAEAAEVRRVYPHAVAGRAGGRPYCLGCWSHEPSRRDPRDWRREVNGAADRATADGVTLDDVIRLAEGL